MYVSTVSTLIGFALWVGCPKDLSLVHSHFLLLIDDLSLQYLIHKYVDDTTLTELLINGSHVSEMQTFLQLLQAWATNNKMKINYTKTNFFLMVLAVSVSL